MSQVRTDAKRYEVSSKVIWQCEGCSYNDFCCIHAADQLTYFKKCENYEYVDERGLICKRPNSVRFILEE